jgi:SAM-dependent methyltransferase
MKPAMISEPNPPPNFNRLARLYRWMELASFGPWLWRCRCAFLDSLVDCRRALVLGDGDGRFTARLLRSNPEIYIDAIDASSAMLETLVQRAGRDVDRVRTFCADARHWQPANTSYDLIVAHFFLDCLTTAEVQSLASSLRDAVSPSALWVVSEFAIPAGHFGRLVARPVVSFLYRAFGILTGLKLRALPDHHTALLQSEFSLEKQRTWLGGLLVSELWLAKGRQAPRAAVKRNLALFHEKTLK